MNPSYFDHRNDLARCTSGQHIRVWLVWRFANRRQPQALTFCPRWSELLLCWLLHHATGSIMTLAVLWKRLGHRLR